MVSKTKKDNFETAMSELNDIVVKLEKGDLPLDEALTAFKEGIELSQFCQNKLEEAEQTVAKMMTKQGQVPLDGDPQ